ncbi:glycoside hydrolase domain-containing protein [Streptomyces sp. SS]|uniref:glycoside hydrolase domain-containing protein n=1 Tax=Streptomyces sp. SS TaxID=260742 RepID=UPI0002D5E1E9|nr:glycoside hydrolase domain-containing protein [Streptomyces sp. SS]
MSARGIRTGLLAALTTLGALAVTTAPQASAAGTAETTSRAVTYQGHTFHIPSGWGVVDLTADPTACVRFDRHVLYLGTPGANQKCPSGITGKTDALLAEPVRTAADRQGSEQAPMDREVRVAADTLTVTATYATDPATVTGILADAGLPTQPRPVTMTAQAAASVATLPVSAVNYTGKGFDACTAPSSSLMQAWKNSSPYGAIGIYVGGSERGCAQPNLTPSWVAQQASAGWKFVPLYVGIQAPAITSPTSQGTAAADDAVNDMAALGFGKGSLVYYDMENYTSGYRGNVLSFLAAWTNRLHALGYKSAVYSSSESGTADLAQTSSGYPRPDVIFNARWNGVANTEDEVLPSHLWADHQRVHQYHGPTTETWGGATLEIDQDYLDVSVGSGPTPTKASLNGDANADMAVLNTAGDLAIRNNIGAGDGFDGGSVVSQGWANFLGNPGQGRLYFADTDGDRLKDLVVHSTDGDIAIRRNLGAGKGFGSSTVVSQGWANFLGNSGQGRLYFADANGDGNADMLVHSTDGDVALRLNIGAGDGFGTSKVVSQGWANFLGGTGKGRLYFADANDDGDADMIVHSPDGDVAIRLNHNNGDYFDGGSVVSQGWANFLGNAGQGRLYFADVTGDGNADMIVHSTDGDIALRPNLGAGDGFGTSKTVSQGWANFLGGTGKGRLYFADANGDGNADMLVHSIDGDIAIRPNLGAGDGFGFGFGTSKTVSQGWANFLGNPGQGRLSFD